MKRGVLHTSTRTTLRANFRSWRDTGITWSVLAGLDAAKVMRRAGHDDLATTLRYVKQADDLCGALGLPFPDLPRDLLGGAR